MGPTPASRFKAVLEKPDASRFSKTARHQYVALRYRAKPVSGLARNALVGSFRLSQKVCDHVIDELTFHIKPINLWGSEEKAAFGLALSRVAHASKNAINAADYKEIVELFHLKGGFVLVMRDAVNDIRERARQPGINDLYTAQTMVMYDDLQRVDEIACKTRDQLDARTSKP